MRRRRTGKRGGEGKKRRRKEARQGEIQGSASERDEIWPNASGGTKKDKQEDGSDGNRRSRGSSFRLARPNSS